jgi:hypothetical protein
MEIIELKNRIKELKISLDSAQWDSGYNRG